MREASDFRYVSQSSKAVRAEHRAGKASHLTMGEAETALAAPEEFLRKNARQAAFHKRAKSARAHREFATSTGAAIAQVQFGGSLKIPRDRKVTYQATSSYRLHH